jgi:lipopolysaccharide assembly protein A
VGAFSFPAAVRDGGERIGCADAETHPLQYGSIRRGNVVPLAPQGNLNQREGFMKVIVWLIRVLVFVLLLVLALANTQIATLISSRAMRGKRR